VSRTPSLEPQPKHHPALALVFLPVSLPTRERGLPCNPERLVRSTSAWPPFPGWSSQPVVACHRLEKPMGWD
jgi:hypothetical protein